MATQHILKTDEWEVLTDSGWQSFDGIVITEDQELIDIGKLQCTKNHKLFVDNEWIVAESLDHSSLENSTVFDLLNVANGNRYLTNGLISHNCLYLDEFAHLEPNMAEDFFTSVFPTLSSGKETKILISSTPNGYNLFHKFWVDAERGLNGFKHQRFDWWCHPDRDQAWADEQKAVLGELKYTQEVLMNFLGSSMTLFTGATLSSFSADTPMVQYGEGQYAGLKLYQKPVTDRKYVMTVDVSRGRHLDYSAFTVFDISDYPHKIVSVYKNNAIAPLQLAALVFEVSKKYNDAYILVEINDVGAQVAEELFYSYEVENMFWTKGGDTLGKKGSDPYPGIRTTTKTKRMGCANLKDIVEKQQLIINDLDMIQEAAVFIQSKTGSYQADEGAHDDLMMTLVLFAWMCTQSWFADLTDKSMRNQMYLDAAKRIEEDLCMDFYYDDGIQEPEAAGFGF